MGPQEEAACSCAASPRRLRRDRRRRTCCCGCGSPARRSSLVWNSTWCWPGPVAVLRGLLRCVLDRLAGVSHCALHVFDRALDLALGFVALALVLELLVAGQIADGLLALALGL